jgi:hypothetical protein
VTATVKTLSATSRVVHIVNRDRVPYRDFVVQSAITPVILAATKCAVERDGAFNGTTMAWRYRAKCRRPLAPGQAATIRVTTSSKRGALSFFVVVKGALLRIDK